MVAGKLGGGGNSSSGPAKVIIKNEEAVIDMFKKKLGSKLKDMREKSLKIKTLSGKPRKSQSPRLPACSMRSLPAKTNLLIWMCRTSI